MAPFFCCTFPLESNIFRNILSCNFNIFSYTVSNEFGFFSTLP